MCVYVQKLLLSKFPDEIMGTHRHQDKPAEASGQAQQSQQTEQEQVDDINMNMDIVFE